MRVADHSTARFLYMNILEHKVLAHPQAGMCFLEAPSFVHAEAA